VGQASALVQEGAGESGVPADAFPTWRRKERSMPLIGEKEQGQIREALAGMTNPVKLVMFTQEVECQYCAQTRQLVEEVGALSDKLSVEVYDFQADKAQVDEYRVDKIPAVAMIGAKDYGIRFYGIPSGYEFSAFIEDIVDVSKGATELGEKTKKALADLKKPVHFQVFSTPT
jgi:glutaredoxin-like protein